MREYTRIHKFELLEVLPYIGKTQHKFHIPKHNKHIGVRHLQTQRMMLISRTQQCVVCQIKGSYFWLEHSGHRSPHFNLYAKNYYGDETMMTMDHVIPKSKGGTTSEDNLQLMCRLCNKAKKDYSISIEDVLKLRFRKDPNLYQHVSNAYMLIDPNYIPTLEQLFNSRKKPIMQEVKNEAA
jgi:5-methylcytosine-specific restriction endonuclease McrA